MQVAANIFWHQWRKEYLPTLLERRKWYQKSKNLKFRDLVIIQSENIPRRHWALSRAIEAYPGNDGGVVRTVKVKTPNNEFIRPSGKLCLLENNYE